MPEYEIYMKLCAWNTMGWKNYFRLLSRYKKNQGKEGKGRDKGEGTFRSCMLNSTFPSILPYILLQVSDETSEAIVFNFLFLFYASLLSPFFLFPFLSRSRGRWNSLGTEFGARWDREQRPPWTRWFAKKHWGQKRTLRGNGVRRN